MSYRVIFLDIDGVLNSRAWFQARASSEHNSFNDLDPHAVERLQRIVDATDARIVISSTWRLLHSVEEIRQVLKDRGLTAKIVGITPTLPRDERGAEIQKWLDMACAFPVKPAGIVILDDDSHMGRLVPWHVKTYFDRGLTDWEVTRAIEMLGRPMPPVSLPEQFTSRAQEKKL